MKYLFTERFATAIERRPWLTRLVFRVEAGVMYTLWWLLQALGPERAARLGARLLGTLGPRSKSKDALVRQQLRVVEPEASAERLDELAGRAWTSLGMVMGEYANLTAIAEGGRLELVDEADLARYRNGGPGAIFFGAHYANWELLPIAIARAGVPMLALYAPIANPGLDALMARARTQLGCGTHARGDSVRPLVKHLRSGGAIGTLIDLRVEDGADLPFFGHETRLPTTAARLALRTGADLVPLQAERVGTARYRVRACTPIEVSTLEDTNAAVEATTRTMIAMMEDWIRADPALWLLANRRWEKRILDPTWEARRAALVGS